jgi:hypothetical protein
MPTLALLDIVSPYVMGGAAIGEPWHELLTFLFIERVETAFDDTGVLITGVARFSAEAEDLLPIYTPPASISWNPSAKVDHRTERHEGAWWDFPDIAIRFRLSVPRASSPVADLVVSGGPGGVPPPLNNAAVAAALAALGQGVGDAPGTVFRLELLLDAATLHLPFLRGAKLRADGMLEEDPFNADVKVTFPKLKFTLTHTAGAVVGGAVTDPQMTLALDSFGAHDIDDPSGTPYTEVARMQPPYALFGPGETLGFGFQSVILDLSATVTPPELLAKAGVGDDFRGIYLPDVRVFVAPEGLKGWGFDVSAREVLIGLGPEGGISAIFGLDVVNPAKAQGAVVTVYDLEGRFLHRIELPEAPDPPAAVPPFAATVHVPSNTFWTVDVTGGRPPYNVDLDGQSATAKAVELAIPPGTTTKTARLRIEDVHAGGQSREATFTLVLTPASLAAGPPAPQSQPATLTVLQAGPPGYTITMLDSPGAERVTVLFTPPDPVRATVTVGGAPDVRNAPGGRLTLPLPHNSQLEVAAEWNIAALPATTSRAIDAYFRYDEPTEKQAPLEEHDDAGESTPRTTAWATEPDNIHASRSEDESKPGRDWLVPGDYLTLSPTFADWLAELKATPGATVLLDGSASAESRPNVEYNVRLSQRRVWAMEALLRSLGVTAFDPPKVQGEVGSNAPGRAANRKVVASFLSGGRPAGTAGAAVRLARPARPPVPTKVEPVRKPPEATGTAIVQFRELHVRVQIDHNRLIAVEARIKIDVETALEAYLSNVKQQNAGALPAAGQGSTNLPVGKRADPNDGVLDLRLQLTLDDTVGRWQVVVSLFELDEDGFLQTPPPTSDAAATDAEQFWRTFFGTMVALAPLLDPSAGASTTPGDLATLAIGAGVPLVAAGSGIVTVPRITVYGGELTITSEPAGTRGALLLDVEVALVIVLRLGAARLIDTDPRNPITVRYKAVGFRTSDRPGLRDIMPVFDSSKGYAIDIPSGGGVNVPAPLGDILQVSGARISRTNPVNLDLDLELKADLGTVSVDRTTIRIPLDGSGAPTITALGVHIDIPGAVEGHGYLAVFPDGFAGQLDATLPSLGVRIAAGLSVRSVADPNNPAITATAVMVTLEVDFPVPILLGNSGLGIYGFGGLFAVHHRRNEDPNSAVPALDWLAKRQDGNPLDLTGWVPEIDTWAIGLGALLGTADGGFILNVKGMVVFELPGPRLLLIMKASVIWPRPPRKGKVEAKVLAVIDLDLGRGRITIGLDFDFGMRPLLRIFVPIRAIFPFSDLANFAIDAGTWWRPVTVTFFELFPAYGYFMIRGRNIPGDYDPPNTPFPLGQSTGFAIATGVSVSFTWGNESSGLYLKVGAAADFALGFSPIMFKGELRIWGELHLWVVGIEASAHLKLTAGQVLEPPLDPGDEPRRSTIVLIDGEAKGKVDLFFFEIEGSVHVRLGSSPGSGPPEPPPLVGGVTLHSRSAALLTGSGVDRPIDGELARAQAAGPFAESDWVPIDAIPVIHFDCLPRVPTGTTFSATAGGAAVAVEVGPPSGSASPAVRRGEPYYTYRIKGVTLSGAMTAGEVPIVWWTPNPGKDVHGPEAKVQLALLSRVPAPHPSAVQRSRHLTDTLEHHWSTVCLPVAPPAAVLWTFDAAATGPSDNGWTLDGIAWPDPPGTKRDTPPDTTLHVAEVWRSGDPAVDLTRPVAPARVIAGLVPCDARCVRRHDRPEQEVPAEGTSRPDEIAALVEVSLFGDISALVHAGRAAATPAAGEPPAGEPPFILTPDHEEAGRLGLQASDFRCVAKALEAPFRQPQDLALLQQHPLAEALVALFTAARQPQPGPPLLEDVVAFSPGETVRARLLLLVPDLLLRSGRFLLRCYGEGGAPLADLPIDGAGLGRVVTTEADLPPEWRDPAGPWFCAVNEVLALFAAARRARRERQALIVLVDTDLPPGTWYLQTGIDGLDGLLERGLARPSYLVGVVETQGAAEVRRHDEESRIADFGIKTVNGALAGMKSPPALLTPNTEYTVRVDWEWAVCDQKGVVPKEHDPGTWKAKSQEFRFRTDDRPLKPRTVTSSAGAGQPETAKTMPVRLDPWVLVTDPDEGTRFFFHGEPITVVFAVDYLLNMYATYGVPLQARVRAASYRNSDPLSPNFAKTWKGLAVVDATPLKQATVFTPWEATMREVLGDRTPCVPLTGDISRHTKLDLNLLLEPRTEYTFDIEPQNAPAPPPGSSTTPLFRRSFSTSRYRDAVAMCADVASSPVRQAPASAAAVAELVALASAPGPLAGSSLDAALRTAGLRPVTDVEEPEVEVLWTPDGGALQPRVVVLRTPEPLVRLRRRPVDYEPPGQPRLGRKVARLELRPFLEIIATPGNASAPVLRQISAPNLGTVVFILDEARGKTLDLSLRRHNDPFLDTAGAPVDIALLRLVLQSAPWEVV